MALDVKNTMKNRLSELLAPHYCCSCGSIGALLCESCKYDIVSDIDRSCLLCRRPTSVHDLCADCQTSYSRAWFAGKREGSLAKLIDLYKFERTSGACETLVDILDAAVPDLPTDCVVVAVPTIAPHVRQRGYDHAAKLARELARRRGLQFARPIRRRTNARQLGAGRALRLKQAAEAFEVQSPVMGALYLLVDDVVTTGATVEHAARVLLESGARDVWVAVLSRQSLD